MKRRVIESAMNCSPHMFKSGKKEHRQRVERELHEHVVGNGAASIIAISSKDQGGKKPLKGVHRVRPRPWLSHNPEKRTGSRGGSHSGAKVIVKSGHPSQS